jgi:hypothetical protein
VEGGKGLVAGAVLGVALKGGGALVKAAAATSAGQATIRVARQAVGAVAKTRAGAAVAEVADVVGGRVAGVARKVGGWFAREGAAADAAAAEVGLGKVAQLPSAVGQALDRAEAKATEAVAGLFRSAPAPEVVAPAVGSAERAAMAPENYAVRTPEFTPERLTYRPSSGVPLESAPGKTTTILGSYDNDMRNVIAELGNNPSTNLGPRLEGLNVLNVPQSLYKSPSQFWSEYNEPFIRSAIARNDRILMATPPRFDVASIKTSRSVLARLNASTGKMELTGFGREYLTLRRAGYRYLNGEMVR